MFHSHKWKIVGSAPGKLVLKGVTTEGNVTSILYQCKRCGKLMSEILDGSWLIK